MIHGEEGSQGLGHFVGKQEGNEREADGTVYTWPLVAKASTINEGDNPILRYEHQFILVDDSGSGSDGGLGN